MARRNLDADVAAVEEAMVAIRRSMTRRSLGRLARQRGRGTRANDMDMTATVEVLDVLEAAEFADTPATVSSVAGSLGVDQPRASKLVAAAVEAGFVRRLADQADGRRILLVRTAAGRAMSDKVHQFRRSVFATAMSSWSRTDQATFAQLLTRFVQALGDLSR